MNSPSRTLRPLFALLLACATSATAAPTVTGLGTLAGAMEPFFPYGLSGDGRVVVGAVNLTAARWEDGVVTALVAPSSWQYASAASADGGVVAGQGWRWDHGTVTRIYDPIGNPVLSTDMSPDGSVLVGYWSGSRVFRWEGGVAEELLPPPGYSTFSRTILSADGSTIASNGRVSDGSGAIVTWQDGVATGLPGLTPTSSSEVYGITADGSTLVGGSTVSGFGDQATIWVDGTPETLPALAGFPYIRSRARGVSADGSVVVGFYKNQGTTAGQATIWFEGAAHRLFNLVVDLGGASVAGWILDEVYFVSDDGNTIVGHGINPSGQRESWMVRFDACMNGRDDDGDGLADYPQDPNCSSPTDTDERGRCQNGLDDDGDGKIDFDGGASANDGVALGPIDPQCAFASKDRESGGGCGIGTELVLVLAALALGRSRLA